MARDTTDLAEGLIRLERDGEHYVGIDTGIPANSPSLRKLAGQKRGIGWIVHDGVATEWKPLGFVEHHNRIHVYGAYHPGRFFTSVLEDPDADKLEAIERVADALAAIAQKGEPSFPFHSRCLVMLDDGGVLVLPTDIMQAIREHQDYAERIKRMERFNHPDRKPEQNVDFALAAAAYYAITGAYPYDSDDEEELHARVRAGSMVPANERDVEIDEKVSQVLGASLVPKQTDDTVDASAIAAAWVDRLRTWRSDGVRRSLSQEERRRLEDEARQNAERLEKGFRRKESVRRNGRTALIIAAIVIIVGTIPFTIIRNALAPRATHGLPPEQVVEVFYTSINKLDHMTMSDAVVDKAGQDLINEVTNLFVLDRQRMSVEMQSGFVDAQQWRDAGMPTLPAGKMPYGVANLKIQEDQAPDGEKKYTVHYERWMPNYDQAETTGISSIVGYAVVDDVSLRMDRQDWVIYKIDRVSQTPLDLQKLRAEAQAAGSSSGQ